MPPLVILQRVLLSLFGTAIPAAVINYRTGPSDVQRRIRYSLLYCFGWLLILPGIIGAANLALLLVLNLRGIHDFAWTSVSHITVVGALAEGTVGAIKYCATASAAAVLSEVYLRTLDRTGPNIPPERQAYTPV